jgi:hypothetical protein
MRSGMGMPLGSHEETCPHGRWSWQPCEQCIAGANVPRIIPMSVEDALKAADTYKSTINGDLVQVLAAEVRRLRQIGGTGAVAVTNSGEASS